MLSWQKRAGGDDISLFLNLVLGTTGHLVEALMSKVGAVMGREGDATPFTEVTVDNISNTLHG